MIVSAMIDYYRGPFDGLTLSIYSYKLFQPSLSIITHGISILYMSIPWPEESSELSEQLYPHLGLKSLAIEAIIVLNIVAVVSDDMPDQSKWTSLYSKGSI